MEQECQDLDIRKKVDDDEDVEPTDLISYKANGQTAEQRPNIQRGKEVLLQVSGHSNTDGLDREVVQ